MNNRGDANWFLISLILALIILASTGFFGGRLFAATADATNTATPSELQAAITACRGQSSLQGVQDADGDKLADFCDPCVNGHDDQQQDADFMADACDTAPTIKDDSGMLACCGDANRNDLNNLLAEYEKADTQKGKAEVIGKINAKCQNTVRSVKPFQCWAGKSSIS